MTFTESIRSALRQYATFSGRAQRSEYWWFYLFTFLAGFAATLIDLLLNAAVFPTDAGLVNTVVNLALLVPMLAVTARRLHDTNRTGWWMLLPLVPAVLAIGFMIAAIGATVASAFTGAPEQTALSSGLFVAMSVAIVAIFCGIVLIVFLCRDSTHGDNRFGPSPKYPVGFYPPAGYGHPQPQAPGHYPQP